jgi:hypothetical protein
MKTLLIIIFLVSQLHFARGNTFDDPITYLNNISVSSINNSEFFGDTKSAASLQESCKNWELTFNELELILRKSVPMSTEEKASNFYWLPCMITSIAIIDDKEYSITVNAASFIEVETKENEEIIILGCIYKSCRRNFLLESRLLEKD